MFCPSCGAEYAIELKYCNRCGANLGAGAPPQPDAVVINVTKPALIIGGLLLVLTLGGFGALIAGALSLAPFLHGSDPLMAMILFGMLTIMIVDIFLVRLLSKIINSALSSAAQPRLTPYNAPAGLPPRHFQTPTTASLQPASSVTENTTRFFEPYGTRSEPGQPVPVQKLKP